MVDATHKSFDASDRSYYAIIKKEIHNLATSAGFPVKKIAELDIIIAELTSNLHKYGQGGELLLAHRQLPDKEYIEVICMDNGPGMQDVYRMMADGFSSSNSMGHGLGSIKRLSDEFDIFSVKGWGTILLSRVFKTPPPKLRLEKKPCIAALVVAKPNEIVSGDGYYVKSTGRGVKLMIADGLGHGVEANAAIQKAVEAFKQCPYDSPVEIIRYIHPAVRKTRGLVATFACFDTQQKVVRIAGVGNISAKLSGPLLSKTPLAYNGIIGHNIPNTMNEQVMSLNDYPQLTLCSDGIRSRWELNKYPGIARCDASIQAAAIYKDFARRTDDMSIIITKF
jgi:anti-sigma regulatory factor (Ser/Thr protein kinase)